MVGIAQVDAQQKTVQLSLGQGERAGILDRILRRQNHERQGHRPGDAVHRDLPLFHNLEQAGLGLGTAAVDLVGEDDLAHDGAGMEFHALGLQLIKIVAGYI